MKRELTPFDELLKKKLEGMEVPYDPAHWDALAQTLQTEGGLENGTDKPIADQLALQHLQDFEPDVPANSWNMFAEKLQAAEVAELSNTLAFDEFVRENLESVEGGQENHWPLMRRRLDEVFTLRGKVYRYKLAEVALMLLLLWTVGLYLPLPKDSDVPADLNSTQAALDQNVNPIAADANDAIATTVEEISTQEIEEGIANEASEPTADQAEPSRLPEQGAASIAIPYTADQNNLTTVLPIESVDPALLTEEALQVDPLPAIAENMIGDGSNPELVSYFNALHPVARLNLRPNAGLTGLGIGSAAEIARRRNSSLQVGMVSGADWNWIYTPEDPVFGTGAYFQDSVGFSAGVLLNFQRGRWTVETGGVYAFMSYRPVTPTLQYGTFDYLVTESFEGIALEQLEIPLQFRYELLPENKKWNFYVQTGASAHVVLKSIYEIRSQAARSDESNRKPTVQEAEDLKSQSILSEKEFPDGVFEGGKLFENSYLSGTLGFGMERHLSHRWSLFMQPQLKYQLPFGGFGPNNDRFHSISFRLGTRVTVW